MSKKSDRETSESLILFLDDDPNRAALAYQRWPTEKKNRTIWATTAEETISILKDYELEEAHLDHDLGGEHYVNSAREDCGMEVVRWIERSTDQQEKLKKTHFIIHSWNIPAAIQMEKRLKALGFKVSRIPFGMG